MTKSIAAIILTIAAPAFAIGLLFGQHTTDQGTYDRGMNEGVAQLCSEVGGKTLWDYDQGDRYSWCDMP